MESNFLRLFVQFYVPIVSFIDEIINDHDRARDIAVEVFQQNRDQLDGYDCSGDYITVIQFLQKKARKECIRELQKRNKYTKALKIFLDTDADFVDNVEQIMIESELDQLMQKVDNGLSEQQRTAMGLFLAGVQTKDAAAWMKKSESAYRSLINAVIKKYKDIIGGFLIIVIPLILSLMAR